MRSCLYAIPVLEKNREDILKAYEVLETCYRTGGKLLVAGNGGSCADAEHIVGELMKGFRKRRPLDEALQHSLAMENITHGVDLARESSGQPAGHCTDGHPGLSTAFANDVDADMIFAQQVCGYGDRDDVFLGISTSGNSKNVDYAVTVAKAKGLSIVGLTGRMAACSESGQMWLSSFRRRRPLRSRNCIFRFIMHCA
ncbi:MAG: SIS domain-containing protein [Clostridium sp.]